MRAGECAGHQHTAFEQPGCHLIAHFRVVEMHADQQPLAGDALENTGVASGQFFQFGDEILAFFGSLFPQPLAQGDADGGDGRAAGQRIAAGGGGVDERIGVHHHAPDFLGGHKSRDGHHAAAQRFGYRNDIRLHIPMLHAPQLAGASHAGLHFIGDQQHIMFACRLADTRPEIIRRNNRPGFSLDRFHHHRCHADAHRIANLQLLLHRVRIAVRYMVNRPAVQNSRRHAVIGFAHQAERSHGFSVETLYSRDKRWFFGVHLGQFDRAFNGLGTAGGKKAVLNIAGGDHGQQLCQRAPQWVN